MDSMDDKSKHEKVLWRNETKHGKFPKHDKFLWRFHRVADYLRASHGCNDNCPAHLQPQLKELDDLLVHASVCKIIGSCQYPNCHDGRVLLGHVFACTTDYCRQCDAMLHLVKLHAGQCATSSCIIPRCSDIKESNRRKKRKLKRKEERVEREAERLKRLRLRELELKKTYDSK